MYALAARDLHQASTLELEVKVLHEFISTKLRPKLPSYAEFESGFTQLGYVSNATKQRSLIRYILLKSAEKNATGLTLDPEQATIEHISPENAAGKTEFSEFDVASIGNLILVNQPSNDKLANRSFSEKLKILKECNVYVDPFVLNSESWDPQRIADRAKNLAKDAYEHIWKI